jgi:hypothetical protein
MSRRVIHNWPVIKLITKKLAPILIKNIIKELSVNQILSIIEIATNILYGNIVLSGSRRETLKPYKRVLNYLSEDSKSIKNKHLYMLKNKLAIKEIILAANKHISSLQKVDNEQSTEKCDSTLGEISSTDEE